MEADAASVLGDSGSPHGKAPEDSAARESRPCEAQSEGPELATECTPKRPLLTWKGGAYRHRQPISLRRWVHRSRLLRSEFVSAATRISRPRLRRIRDGLARIRPEEQAALARFFGVDARTMDEALDDAAVWRRFRDGELFVPSSPRRLRKWRDDESMTCPDAPALVKAIRRRFALSTRHGARHLRLKDFDLLFLEAIALEPRVDDTVRLAASGLLEEIRSRGGRIDPG